MTDSIETSEREGEDPREPIRLPVREMPDEPAPQRAAQEGDLPPLPHWCEAGSPMGQQMQSYARTAIAAAGGGVPQTPPADEQWLEIFNEAWMTLTPEQREAALADTGASHPLVAACRLLASSPQPEAAPAVAQAEQGDTPNVCPKCGSEEWDEVYERGYPPPIARRCTRCDTEWNTK